MAVAISEVSSGRASERAVPQSDRLPELDGLRGIAILLVVSLHYITNSRTTNPGFGLLYHFAQAFRLGWSGVDLFFVLSGFLIGGILLDARQTSNYFRTFYLRRVHRILPVYYVWLAAARIYSEQGRYLESMNAVARAIAARPVIAGRPIKRMASRLGLARNSAAHA